MDNQPASPSALARALEYLNEPFEIGEQGITPALGIAQNDALADDGSGHNGRRHDSLHVPSYRLENLGDGSFRSDHGLRFAYVAGAMANGIGSAEVVEAMGRAGMLGFFGAAGLSLSNVEEAINRLAKDLNGTPFGFNLIHSPQEPALEAAVVDLYLKRGIRLVEASAYLDLTLPIVRYRMQGIRRDATGRIVTPNRIIAKVSRVEVASKFMAPPPGAMVRELLNRGEFTPNQAQLVSQIPMAQDVTAEADSGGHTDNRPLITLLPTLLALRDRIQGQYQFSQPVRVGAAGGISTPASAAAAFAMGAAYILTGSVNQSCLEAGTSEAVRQMLAHAEQADTMMGPAADMFEMGVKVQVLKRGTMFPMRAAKLYDLYRVYNSLDELPLQERIHLERTIFRAPVQEIWKQTQEYFQQRDPSQIDRAERDAKHKLALVFRWYLGQSSRWAKGGEPSRKIDYQIWCGPAMAAFNEWVKGSFLERPENRRVAIVAMNILYGAAVLLRANHLRCQGACLPANFPQVRPLEPEEIRLRLIHNNE